MDPTTPSFTPFLKSSTTSLIHSKRVDTPVRSTPFSHSDRRQPLKSDAPTCIYIYAGDGFHSDGHRMGVSHNLPPHLAKQKALAAAEERAKKARLMGPGGKLGGTKAMGKSMRELAMEVGRSLFSLIHRGTFSSMPLG